MIQYRALSSDIGVDIMNLHSICNMHLFESPFFLLSDEEWSDLLSCLS